LIAGLKKSRVVVFESGKWPEHVGKMAVSYEPVAVVSTLRTVG